MLYVILAADLKACSPVNLILKYADDTNLLVPQCSDTSILDYDEHGPGGPRAARPGPTRPAPGRGLPRAGPGRRLVGGPHFSKFLQQ